MKPSLKLLNFHPGSGKSSDRSHDRHFNSSAISLILLLSILSIAALPPENSYASVKKHKSSNKISQITCKSNKASQSSTSDMLAYFSKVTGKRPSEYEISSSVLKQNETIVELLKPYGLTHADIFEFAKESKKTFNLRQMKAGKSYSIVYDRTCGKKAKYLIYEKDTKKYVVLPINCNADKKPSSDKNISTAKSIDTKENDAATDKKVGINKTSLKQISKNTGKNEINTSNMVVDGQERVRIRQVSGVIKTGLHKTASRMGMNRKLVNQLTSIFKSTPALSDLKKGDLLQVAFQEKRGKNGKLKTGVITAAIVSTGNKDYYAYRFTYNGKHGYYDENGNSLESSFLKAPLKYREISSGFSARRFHPIQQIYKPHPGIDYAAPKGTPVKSVGNGIVVCKEYSESKGNYIKIKHPGVGISEYMHLSGFGKGMKINKKVSTGEIIGFVGMTGYATGPHLDLRFMVNNRYVDYRTLKLPKGEALPKKFRNVFFQHVAMINKQWNRTARRELSYNGSHPMIKHKYEDSGVLRDRISNDPS